MVRGFGEAIQLLVDNELSASDADTLLLQCEEEPEGWRRLALAFLEARAITEATASWGRVSEGASSSVSRTESDANLGACVVSPLPRRLMGWRRAMGLFGAMAAAVAILVSGQWIERVWRDQASPRELIQGERSADPVPLQAGLDASSSEGNLRLERPVTGATDSELPIRPAALVSGNWSDRLSPQTRMEWLKRGLWIEETPQFELVEHEGARYAVPDSKLNVTYVGDWVYQ